MKTSSMHDTCSIPFFSRTRSPWLTLLGIVAVSMGVVAPQVGNTADPTQAPLPLRNGENRVDFTGDGRPDLVVLAHRENFNAHCFDVASFFVRDERPVEGTLLSIVPIFTDEGEKLAVTTSRGADCVLHDFRLLPEQLVVADRAPGSSFMDPGKVTFDFYALRQSHEGTPGELPIRFEKVRRRISTHRYCDVGIAFADELGIPEDRRDDVHDPMKPTVPSAASVSPGSNVETVDPKR